MGGANDTPVILRPPSAPHRRSIKQPFTLLNGTNNRPVYGLASCLAGIQSDQTDVSPSREARSHHYRCHVTFPVTDCRSGNRETPTLTYRCGGSQGLADFFRAPCSRLTLCLHSRDAPIAMTNTRQPPTSRWCRCILFQVPTTFSLNVNLCESRSQND